MVGVSECRLAEFLFICVTLPALSGCQNTSPPLLWQAEVGACLDIDFSPNDEFVSAAGIHPLTPDMLSVVWRANDPRQEVFRKRGGMNAGWSSEHLLIAHMSDGYPSIDVVSSSTWETEGVLTGTFPGGSTVTVNGAGDVFAVSWSSADFEPRSYPALVWWNALRYTSKRAEQFSTTAGPSEDVFCVDSAVVNKGVRVVQSYCYERSPEVVEVSKDEDGRVLVVRERSLGGSGPTWMRLSSDGAYVAILRSGEAGGFQVFRVDEDKLSTVVDYGCKVVLKKGSERASAMRQRVEISRDGRVAAAAVDDRVVVFSVETGAKLVEVPVKALAIGVASSGGMLLTSKAGTRHVRYYRIPLPQ